MISSIYMIRYRVKIRIGDDGDDDDDKHLYRANSIWICSNARNKKYGTN